MGHRISYNIPGHAHFLTFSCWQRRPFLADDCTCAKLAAALNHAREIEQFDIWAYVFMPEHVHMLIRPRREEYEIAKILRRMKEAFARNVLNHWREHLPARFATCADTACHPVRYRFWQPGGGFDRNLYTPTVIRRTVTYIESNPIRRGLVGGLLEWKWSSARARAELPNVPLQIDPIE